jgi:hypothetical protein
VWLVMVQRGRLVPMAPRYLRMERMAKTVEPVEQARMVAPGEPAAMGLPDPALAVAWVRRALAGLVAAAAQAAPGLMQAV